MVKDKTTQALEVLLKHPDIDPYTMRDKENNEKLGHLFDEVRKHSHLWKWLLASALMRAKRFDWYTLDSCDITKSAKKSIGDYLNSLDNVIEKGYGLYLWSRKPGSWKTTMMRHVLEQMFLTWRSVYFDSLVTIKCKWKEEFDLPSDPLRKTFNSKMETVHTLAIDDIGSEKLSEWLEEQLKDIIDDRYNNWKVMMFTSNYPIKELRISEKLKDRIIGMCHEVHFGESSLRKLWK